MEAILRADTRNFPQPEESLGPRDLEQALIPFEKGALFIPRLLVGLEVERMGPHGSS